jgi:hypothetical protein
MGEVRLRGAGAGHHRNRGWTPASLAAALFRANRAVSERTLRRGCADGSIPCVTTPGGHRRIDAAWVRLMFPVLEARLANSDADDRAA